MYPKKQPKSDQERFLAAFKKRVGATPEEYVRRKLASGMDEAELCRLYDLLAVEVAMKARCTALRYDTLELDRRPAPPRARGERDHPGLQALRRADGPAHRAERRAQGAEILGLLELSSLPLYDQP